MEDHTEEVRQKDFKLLKQLAGEEVARKYASPKNYGIRNVGFGILKYSILSFAKLQPARFILIMLLAICVVSLFVYNFFSN